MVINFGSILPKRILIVDDNKDAAELLSMLLQSFEHDVRIVYDGYDCLNVMRTYDADIVFLDLGMPGMNGYDVAAALRANPACRHTCLAAVTGWDDDATRIRVQQSGFNFHIAKPADVESLMHVVKMSSMSELNWFESELRSGKACLGRY